MSPVTHKQVGKKNRCMSMCSGKKTTTKKNPPSLSPHNLDCFSTLCALLHLKFVFMFKLSHFAVLLNLTMIATLLLA